VVCEGVIRDWANGHIVEAGDQKYFYEVLTNLKLGSQLLKVARKQAG